ncbi:uncharacterized protein LOC133321963 [Musca vetustissima]|uniref:uncharacterized protein LOC133321963 n=1 Tax=Musca vetustissima TaxID=27455 RepID=UPI002AB5E86F|nr:uncharacterized protein LOC133321963 [Musca vetustissima]
MKFVIVWTFLALILLSATNAEEEKKDCGDPEKDGQVTAWFKNAGCTLKPYADTVATKAKEFGNTVAQKYDEVKHKLTDSEEKPDAASSAPAATVVTSTEKIPLAPLPGHEDASKSSTGEHYKSTPVVPEAIDDRFLLQYQGRDCPNGQVRDHRNQCRAGV